MRRKARVVCGVIALTVATAAQAAAADRLRVCLDEDIPLLSVHDGKEGTGFDLAVAEGVASRLGRSLSVQWFENKLDADSSPTLEANALLSDGRCQLVGGYPLVRDTLGRPGAPTARLPDFEGAKPEDRRRRVAMGELIPSKPYRQAPLTVVLSGAASSKQVAALSDLRGSKIVVEASTLSDAILMLFDDGRLVDHITHLIPGRSDLLGRLDKGEFDATLIDLRRFDAYRAEHPDTALKASGFYYRIGFNMGFVALAKEHALIDQVNAALRDMAEKGEILTAAKAAGLTYVPPRAPDVLEHLTLKDLREN
jgi:ABC-type amino acid transport substrate-binding protein